ncbi:MAG: PKD domain-containing protein [Bacteroidia bacterium]|nr:PKD domain-containing protein [Bacteroidia bacterium]
MFFSSEALGQCTIQSNDFTCIGDLISFKASGPQSVTSVTWSFGDTKTSKDKEPNHTYASAGQFTVKATITLADGSTCQATKTITVYAPPKLDLSINPSSTYCLTSNEVCLNDNSTTGGGGTKNVTIVTLWDDGGKTESSNPKTGDKICYSYKTAGKYTIFTEITNDKGCKADQEIDVEILFDFEPKFSSTYESETCDTQHNSFKFDTSWTKYFGDIELAYYDFGDGTRDTVKPLITDSILHGFTKSGTYPVNLFLKFKNGCETRFQRLVPVSLDKVDINHKKLDTTKCYGSYFEFSHPNIFGANYLWNAYDTGLNFVRNFGGARNAFFNPRRPGKYYIELIIERGNCRSVLQYDSIEAVGVKAEIQLLNNSQCVSKDTVYFCNRSLTYKAGNLNFLWKFGDDNAEPCTTDTKNKLNVGKNCNYSVDAHAKHKYDTTKCDEISFVVADPTNGCRDSTRESVTIIKPLREHISVSRVRQCLFKPVTFEKEECLQDVKINYDSACDKYNFVEYQSPFSYEKTCDSTNWVTWGAAVRTGSNKIFRSCDTTDYYYDDDRVCVDTFWHHRDFRLNRSPRAQSFIRFVGCLPSTLHGEFYTDTQTDVRKIIWEWGDGTWDSLSVPLDSLVLPKYEHTYYKSGDYEGFVTLVTDSGCSNSAVFRREIGFFNDFTFDQPVCPGAPVSFYDTIRYWDDTTRFWRHFNPFYQAFPEKVVWHFGDTTPWTGDNPHPTHVFDEPGDYTVRMVAIDKTGCTDTTTKVIEVVEIRAGIKDIKKKLVCDDIIQLFDSSIALDNPMDSIETHYWDFGDGKSPSFLKDPFHFYSSYGDFKIIHIVENTMGCVDTAYIQITINGPIPQFDILSDTVACVPHTVEFQNNSERASDFIWFFGDTASNANTLSTKFDTNVRFTYTKPGTYYIYLYAGDSVVNPDNNNNIYYCNSIFPDTNAQTYPMRRVVILPIPKVDFSVDGIFCKDRSVQLTDQSDTIYDLYRWYWGSDSIIGTDSSVSFVLQDTGAISIDYRPRYIPTGPYQRHCFDSITKDIQVFDNSVDFDFTKDSLCPTFFFTADAESTDELTWDFDHPSSGPDNMSWQPYVEHSFADQVGSFNVCLISMSKEGCLDTACKVVESDHEFNMMIPNVITPNVDGLNDVFEIEIDGEDLYELSIYNRWGELMYESDVDQPPGSALNWDGTEMKSGKDCPAGTYFYIFKFREACIDDAPIEKYSGTVTVIRD